MIHLDINRKRMRIHFVGHLIGGIGLLVVAALSWRQTPIGLIVTLPAMSFFCFLRVKTLAGFLRSKTPALAADDQGLGFIQTNGRIKAFKWENIRSISVRPDYDEDAYGGFMGDVPHIPKHRHLMVWHRTQDSKESIPAMQISELKFADPLEHVVSRLMADPNAAPLLDESVAKSIEKPSFMTELLIGLAIIALFAFVLLITFAITSQ